MTIWVDSDSCPVRVREVISKASFRLSVLAVFVANREIPIKIHKYINLIITEKKEQSADIYIVESAKLGDLVITRDIPLAARLVDNEIAVINDRGTYFTKENVKERLSVRNFVYKVRFDGPMTAKMGQFSKKDLQNFSNTFDTLLTRLLRSTQMK